MRCDVLRGWALAACVVASSSVWANMADNSHRSDTAGVDLITYQTQVKQVVAILGSMPAGDAMASGSDNIAIPTLTGMMLDRGTKTLDKYAIAEQLDNVGAEISFAVGTQSLEIRAKCLNKDLPLVLGLLASELRTPAFTAAEFAKAKQQFIGSLQESLQRTDGRAQEAFLRAIFPEGHPNRPHSIAEYLAAAKSATLDEVKAFHAKYYGPAHLTLVLVGDVPVERTQAEIAKDFAGWRGGADYIRPAKPAGPTEPREITVPLPDKPSVSMILGQATGLRYRDPDALRAAGGDGDPRPWFHGASDGHRARQGGSHLQHQRGGDRGQHRRRRVGHLGELRALAAREGHCIDAPGARQMVAGGHHRCGTQRPQARHRRRLFGGPIDDRRARERHPHGRAARL